MDQTQKSSLPLSPATAPPGPQPSDRGGVSRTLTPASKGNHYGGSRNLGKPSPESIAAELFDEPMPTGDPRTANRLDFLCVSCGHTVATVNEVGKQVRKMIGGLRLNCPRCGLAKGCESIVYADPAITPTHEWLQDGNRLGLKEINGCTSTPTK